MTEQKRYQSIVRLGHKTTLGLFEAGDEIVIQEKIDGANASFRRVGNELVAYSRNTELSEENTLQGFYQFVQELDIQIGEGLIFFGEFLNPHKVKYPEHEKKFFLFDIYDVQSEKYLPFSKVKAMGKSLGFNIVPTFYEGEYISFEHLQTFVGKTELGGKLGDIDTGEGIVVKHINKTDRFGNQLFVKLVTDAFREVQGQKAPKDPQMEQTHEQVFVELTVTEARVEKIIYKLVDEGIIDEVFGIEDMGTILRNTNPRILEDIISEEADLLTDEYDEKQLSKAVARKVAMTVKKILNKSNK